MKKFPFIIALLKNPAKSATWDNLSKFSVAGSMIQYGTVDDAVKALNEANFWNQHKSEDPFRIYSISLTDAVEEFPDDFTIHKLSA